jgi:SAM-dependent methyltransferase
MPSPYSELQVMVSMTNSGRGVGSKRVAERFLTSLMRQIASANSLRYEDANEVDSYTRLPHHAHRLHLARDLLHKALAGPSDDTPGHGAIVVELGSATGVGTLPLSERGYRVIASDVEHVVLTAAVARGMPAVLFDATDSFPFREGSVHAIFMGELIEHLFDTAELLMECRRALVNGGYLLITTPNLARLQDRFAFLFGQSPRQIDALHSYRRLHIRPFTLLSLKHALSKCGFDLIDATSNYIGLEFGRGIELESVRLAHYLPHLGSSLIVLAKKTSYQDR